MIKPETITTLGEQILSALPDSLLQTHKDIGKNVHSVLQIGLQKLELVNREDFDAQAAVLARARRQLDALEHKLAHIESKTADL